MTTVYLVDDHVLMRQSLRAVLEDAGHTVLGETQDPLQALPALHALKPAVLILDLNLGRHSGFELLAAVQQQSLPLRCLVLTMSAQPRDVQQAQRLGALGYVLKGSSKAELLAALNAALQGQLHLAPELAALVDRALDQPAGGFNDLSPREQQVVLGVVRGLSSSALAQQLALSPKTVDSYRSRLMTKLGVDDVTALVRLAVREGWIDADPPLAQIFHQGDT